MRSTPAASADAIIVGGGVAGLAAARALAERKLRVVLLEREPRLASQASGNNAAIFRTLESDAASAVLPRRSRALMDAWFGAGLLEETGLVLVSESASEVMRLAAAAKSGGVPHSLLAVQELEALAPSLAGGAVRHALLLHDSGILNVPAFTAALADRAHGLGAVLQTSRAVAALTHDAGRITGVTLADGTRLSAGCVVLAAGAWNASLGESVNAGVGLVPFRRHLVELRAQADVAASEPVVWRLEDEVYYRRQGSGVLASPCDETRSQLAVGAAAPSASDPSASETLNQKLMRTAPALAGGSIVRAWACFRTFAADRELVVGPDPRFQGLHWFGGLGGRGMSVALAAAEILRAHVLGESLPLQAAAVAPARLFNVG
jgi:D-arginine dehydrogenase